MTLDTDRKPREAIAVQIDPNGRWSRFRFEFCNALEAAMDMRDNAKAIEELASLGVTLAPDALTAQDYAEATESHLAHVHDLDVAMNGDDAAERPLLIDIKDQLLKRIKFYRRAFGK